MPLSKEMKKIIILIVSVVFSTIQLFSQQNYRVSWGTTSYDTLTDYTSIIYELLPEPLLGHEEIEISFGFNFPFFDSYFNSISIDADGYGYFANAPGYNLYMFTGEYESHLESGLPIYSDWRYMTDTTGVLDILKIEWRNVGIYDDVTSTSPTDHRINFQTWFYENGIIELHFGETDLTNTPFYNNTDGFIWEDGESYGPWIGIAKNDASEVYYITGTNSDIFVVTSEENADIYYDIPHLDHYFRFLPDELSGLPPESLPETIAYSIYPNPVMNCFIFKADHEVSGSYINSGVKIFTISGELVKSQNLRNINEQIDISEFPAGIYFVQLIDEKFMRITRKIIKL